MQSGLGFFLGSLLNVPMLIVSCVLVVGLPVLLLVGGRRLNKALKILVVVLFVLALMVLAIIVTAIIGFGNHQPTVPSSY